MDVCLKSGSGTSIIPNQSGHTATLLSPVLINDDLKSTRHIKILEIKFEMLSFLFNSTLTETYHREWYLLPYHREWYLLPYHREWYLLPYHREWYLLPYHREWYENGFFM